MPCVLSDLSGRQTFTVYAEEHMDLVKRTYENYEGSDI